MKNFKERVAFVSGAGGGIGLGIVLRGIQNNDFYILTHPQLWPQVAQYHDSIRQAFIKKSP
jgi:NAD(P)-dependent dehydrogenase (short-subunit alcohol dehydrogenase family)